MIDPFVFRVPFQEIYFHQMASQRTFKNVFCVWVVMFVRMWVYFLVSHAIVVFGVTCVVSYFYAASPKDLCILQQFSYPIKCVYLFECLLLCRHKIHKSHVSSCTLRNTQFVRHPMAIGCPPTWAQHKYTNLLNTKIVAMVHDPWGLLSGWSLCCQNVWFLEFAKSVKLNNIGWLLRGCVFQKQKFTRGMAK